MGRGAKDAARKTPGLKSSVAVAGLGEVTLVGVATAVTTVEEAVLEAVLAAALDQVPGVKGSSVEVKVWTVAVR